MMYDCMLLCKTVSYRIAVNCTVLYWITAPVKHTLSLMLQKKTCTNMGVLLLHYSHVVFYVPYISFPYTYVDLDVLRILHLTKGCLNIYDEIPEQQMPHTYTFTCVDLCLRILLLTKGCMNIYNEISKQYRPYITDLVLSLRHI